jgi:hypothetical protein
MKDASGAFSDREKGMFGIHWINLTSGEIDTSWITADFTSVESAVQALFSSNAGMFSNQVRLVEHRWYRFGPSIGAPNPPVRVTTLGTPLAGTATSAWIHQVGCTVTLRTALRRHWGRIYLPIADLNFGANGQGTAADVDGIAAAARTMLLAPGTAQGVTPIVWDRARKIGFGVTAIEVDSVPDIQRRRRPRTVFYRKIYTA